MIFNPLPKSLFGIETIFITVFILCHLTTPLVSESIIDNSNNDNSTNYPTQKDILNPYGIQIEPINSTTVKIWSQISKTLLNPTPVQWKDQHKVWILIRYQLIANDIKLPCDQSEKELESLYNLRPKDLVTCKNKLFGFGKWEGYGTDRQELEENGRLCDPVQTSLILSINSTDDYVLIPDLLPYQAYHFNITFSIEHKDDNGTITVGSTKYTEYVRILCMPIGPPSHAPQTDVSSFYYRPEVSLDLLKSSPKYPLQSKETKNNMDKGNLRLVTLLWRPLPLPFVTSWDLQYIISCIEVDEKLSFKHIYKARVSYESGQKPIEQPLRKDRSYKCVIYAENGIGISENSTIIIPGQLFDLSKFELYAVAVESGKFVLSWTDASDIMLEQASANRSDIVLSGKKPGIYTYIWCIRFTPSSGCMEIVGYGRAIDRLAHLEPHDPIHFTPTYSQFGISYSLPHSNLSTGIVWNDCVSVMHSEGESILNPMLITKSSGLPDNHTSIYVSWLPKGCKSIYVTMTEFEINYCRVGEIDPCSLVTAKNRTRAEIRKFDFDSLPTKDCSSRFLPSPSSEVTITNLTPSTEYVVRLRPVFLDVTIEWSEASFAITSPQPEKLKKCINYAVWALLMIALILIGLISYVISRTARRRYEKFKTRLNRANSSIPQQIEKNINKSDNFSDIGLKYWINRYSTIETNEPSMSESESSLNQAVQESKNCINVLQNGSSDMTSGIGDENGSRESGQVAAGETKAKDKRESEEEKGTYLCVPSMSGYVSTTQIYTKTTDQLYCDNLVSDDCPSLSIQESTPPDSSDQISITSHSSFLENIFNQPPSSAAAAAAMVAHENLI